MTVDFEILRSEYKSTILTAFKTKSTASLEDKVKSLIDKDVEKNPLDLGFRDVLFNLMEKEVDVCVLKDYVEFSVMACRKGLNSPTLPVILLGDIFDILTLDMCENMFAYVEQNVHVWKEEIFFSACKNNLLRLCNDLLKRLSRTTTTVFCGKILLFLAKFFPFSERSGLNIVSEFNLENVTEYGTEPSDESAVEINSEEEKQVVDFTFYCKFWQLQDFFRNPNQCYNKVQWKLFSSHSTAILNTFQGVKLDFVSYNEKTMDLGYFAKYLTSRKLLDLQLHDVNFRRSVLLQFLITFQYFTSVVKFKNESNELKSDQKEWISSNTEKVYSLLEATPPDGKEFAEIVKNILNREELWNIWKNDSCLDVRTSYGAYETDSKREFEKHHLGDIIRESNKIGKFYIGSGELTKLWNQCPNNLKACKGHERDFMPTLEEYFADAIKQLESSSKDEESVLKDSNMGWRALRLLARKSPHFFTYHNTIFSPLSLYLEMMVKKISHEKKGKDHMDSQNDNEIENILAEEEQATEDLKPNDNEEFVDDNPTREHKNITMNQLLLISEKVAPDWIKLAVKLDFKQDEIEFFAVENPTLVERAKNILQLWFEDDEDASLDNLLYILEGLEMLDAAEVVRNEISNASDS